MWRVALLVLIVLTAGPSAPALAQEREWTYASGLKFKAKLVRELDGEAVFLKDRQLITVPLDDLSEVDRKLVLSAADRGLSNNDVPTKSASSTSLKAPIDVDRDGDVAPLVKSKTPVVNRDWTDTSGNRTQGKFVRVHEQHVIILRGARPVSLPFETLSPADQNYVNQVLTERGEQPLDVPESSAPQENAPRENTASSSPGTESAASGSASSSEPTSTAKESDQGEKASGSQFFDELRAREEARRREQEEYAAQNTTPPAETSAEAAASSDSANDSNESPLAPPDGPGLIDSPLSNHSPGDGLRLEGKTLAEMRPVLIMAGVLLGLFAVLGVIVFIATTIASSNTPRRQRRLY